jgi:hypothetical protein
MKNKFLKSWEDSTNNLAKYFSSRYFGKKAEYYWISDEIGGVFVISDYFFSTSDMVDFIRYSYTKDKMFEYYDMSLKSAEKGKNPPINIKNYIKLK